MLFAACAKEGDAGGGRRPRRSRSRRADYRFVAPSHRQGRRGGDNSRRTRDRSRTRRSYVKLKDDIDSQEGRRRGEDRWVGGRPRRSLAVRRRPERGGSRRGAGRRARRSSAGATRSSASSPTRRGAPHAGLGMVKELTVEAQRRREACRGGDVHGGNEGLRFKLPESWNGAIEFTNTGKQPTSTRCMESRKGRRPKGRQKSFQPETGRPGPRRGRPGWWRGASSRVTDTFEVDLEPGDVLPDVLRRASREEGAALRTRDDGALRGEVSA